MRHYLPTFPLSNQPNTFVTVVCRDEIPPCSTPIAEIEQKEALHLSQQPPIFPMFLGHKKRKATGHCVDYLPISEDTKALMKKFENKVTKKRRVRLLRSPYRFIQEN